MRILRSIRPLVAVCAVALLGALPALACPGSSASYLSGKFDADGNFVVSALVDPSGNTVESAAGFVCNTITMDDNVALAAADHADQTIWVVGNVDFDNHALHVLSYTTAHGEAGMAGHCGGAKAAGLKSASAKTAGAGCCPSSAAKSASAGSGCGSAAKSASAKTAGSGCGSAAESASIKTAGSGCGSAAKSASAKTAGAGCTPGCTEPCGPGAAAAQSVKADAPAKVEGHQVVFAVSGMTCGGCTAKVESAVQALEIPGMKACEVSLEDATAIVTVSDDQKVDPESIAQAITAVGFPAKVKETGAKS